MDLTVKSPENVKFMIEKMMEKLRIINAEAMQNREFDENQYEDILDLYNHVMKKDHFSPSEMQAIVEAIGSLGK